MEPLRVFENGHQRSEYLLDLYHALRNRRQRGTRRDWARRFTTCMGWRGRQQRIERVVGRHTLLILRQGSALSAEHFKSDWVAELLRGAVVGVVAALDRYCHELVLSRVVGQLRRPEKNVNRDFQRLSIPIFKVKAAVLLAGKRRGRGGGIRTRPLVAVRYAVQDLLHLKTFQGSQEIASALSMVGIQNIWKRCHNHKRALGGTERIMERLNKIVDRRNKIVHESDVVLKRKARHVTLHNLSPAEVEEEVGWIGRLVRAMDAVANG